MTNSRTYSGYEVFELLPGPALSRRSVGGLDWNGQPAAYLPLPASCLSEQPRIKAERVVIFAGRLDREGPGRPLVWEEGSQPRCAVDIHDWLNVMEREMYRPEHRKPFSARLPFHYHRLPGFVRNALASLLLRSVEDQTGYPVHALNPGFELFLAACGVPRPRYPERLVLTHDIDTRHGFDWVRDIARIEEEHGFRSIWNVVPLHYPIDEACLVELIEGGHEIGLHGIWHDNSEAFLSPNALRQHLASLETFRRRFSIKGYRGPSWYRTRSMYPVLSEFFDYDMSTLDNDFTCPGGNGGVGHALPFWIEDDLLEIPCTLPLEAPVFLGVNRNDLLSYWQPKIEWIHQTGGLLVVNTHPDPNYSGNPQMITLYETFLGTLRESGWKSALPADIFQSARVMHATRSDGTIGR